MFTTEVNFIFLRVDVVRNKLYNKKKSVLPLLESLFNALIMNGKLSVSKSEIIIICPMKEH